MLTDEQKRDVVLIASVGCDRETAAKYVGCRVEQLSGALAGDDGFANEVRRAEAGCELAHMRSVQQAARDEKHWRASVWWLERRLPERYAPRGADVIGRREMESFFTSVAESMAAEVNNEDDRRRVMEKLNEFVERVVVAEPEEAK